MVKHHRRAGQNIRKLALKRRFKALTFFATAGLVVVLPIFLVRIFDDFLKELSADSPAQSGTSLDIPLIFYGMLLAIALGLVANGMALWKRANRADQGARGEEEISRELSQLELEGWTFEYGMRLGNRLGDADIVCISPRSKAYVIDVKSHKGVVISDGKQLIRRMGQQTYPFEKDFVKQVMQQALQVHQQKGLKFVTPILVFSNARVSVPNGILRKVHIAERSELITLLKSLG